MVVPLCSSLTEACVCAGLSYIPAPKAKLPSHEESYNPPAEYLPTEEERAAAAMAAEEDEGTESKPFQPRAFHSLRLVPAYEDFIKERFERCLDLYLCPRARRRRVQVCHPAQLSRSRPGG
jgi:ribosome biogenesis protein ERB1